VDVKWEIKEKQENGQLVAALLKNSRPQTVKMMPIPQVRSHKYYCVVHNIEGRLGYGRKMGD
jgi:hypothetical protein